MIVDAKIVAQPNAGDFFEKIYDLQNVWNSQDWTFIKFTNSDFSEWIGQFRGFPIDVKISESYKSILILTSDYLYQLDSLSGILHAYEEQPQYKSLTLAPDDSFIIADYMSVEKITNDINDKKLIESPIEMDFIEFKDWKDGLLEFTCDEFIFWENHYLMTYNYTTEKIEIKNRI